jgi:hypothetical protein
MPLEAPYAKPLPALPTAPQVTTDNMLQWLEEQICAIEAIDVNEDLMASDDEEE